MSNQIVLQIVKWLFISIFILLFVSFCTLYQFLGGKGTSIDERYALALPALIHSVIYRDPVFSRSPTVFPRTPSYSYPISRRFNDYCQLGIDGTILLNPEAPCWTVQNSRYRRHCDDRPFWNDERTCVELQTPHKIAENAALVDRILDIALHPCRFEAQVEPEDQPNLFYARNSFRGQRHPHDCGDGEPDIEIYLSLLETHYSGEAPKPRLLTRVQEVIRVVNNR